MHTLKVVLLIKPHPGFQVAVFANRLFGAGGGCIGGTRFGTVACFLGEPLDAILRPLVPAGAGRRHFRFARWRGPYPFGLI